MAITMNLIRNAFHKASKATDPLQAIQAIAVAMEDLTKVLEDELQDLPGKIASRVEERVEHAIRNMK